MGSNSQAAPGDVLVAIMNNLRDFDIARDQHWYRIPVRSAQRRLKDRWPPRWLALYQTMVFGPERWAINYYADVRAIRKVTRRALLPQEPAHARQVVGAGPCASVAHLGPDWRIAQSFTLFTIGYGR